MLARAPISTVASTLKLDTHALTYVALYMNVISELLGVFMLVVWEKHVPWSHNSA